MQNKTLYLLCFLIAMVSASAGAAEPVVTEPVKPALKWFVFREDCYDKFVNK